MSTIAACFYLSRTQCHRLLAIVAKNYTDLPEKTLMKGQNVIQKAWSGASWNRMARHERQTLGNLSRKFWTLNFVFDQIETLHTLKNIVETWKTVEANTISIFLSFSVWYPSESFAYISTVFHCGVHFFATSVQLTMVKINAHFSRIVEMPSNIAIVSTFDCVQMNHFSFEIRQFWASCSTMFCTSFVYCFNLN